MNIDKAPERLPGHHMAQDAKRALPATSAGA
jgi:hypothetical protein